MAEEREPGTALCQSRITLMFTERRLKPSEGGEEEQKPWLRSIGTPSRSAAALPALHAHAS